MDKKKQPAKKEVVGSGAGISGSKRAKEAPSHPETFLKSIIEQSPLSLWISDSAGTLIQLNQSCRDLFSITDEEVVGKYNIFEDNIVEEQGFLPLISDVFKKGTTAKFTLKYDPSQLNKLKLKIKTVILEVTVSAVMSANGRITNAVIQHVDITERKSAEETLKESEERYRSILEQMDDAYYEVDLAGNFTFLNESHCRKLGYSREELMGKSYGLTVPEDDIKKLFAASKAVFKSGEPDKCFSHSILRKDGSILFAESFIGLRRNKQGAIIGFKTVSRDVTDRKQAERALEIQRNLGIKLSQSNDLIQALQVCLVAAIEVSGMDSGGIYIVDPDTGSLDLVHSSGLSQQFINSSSHYAKSSAYLSLIMAGNPVYANYSQATLSISAAQKAEVLKALAVVPVSNRNRVVACLNIGSHTVEEIPLGSRNALETIASQIGGAIERMQTLEVLSGSEERYRLLADNVHDIIWTTDMNFRTTYVSPSVESVLGFKPEERMKQDITEQLTPSSLSIAMNTLARELATEQTGQSNLNRPIVVETEYYHKDGSILCFENSVTGIRNDQGILTGLLGVARSITERKQMEEALGKSEAQYRLLSEHMTDFVWLMDMDLKLTYQSPSAEKLTGFTQQELMELPFEKRIAPGSLKAAAEMFFKELPRVEADADYNPLIRLELEYYSKDGTTAWSDNKFSIIRDENGRPVAILGEARDITERKHADAALRENEQRLREVLDNSIYASYKRNLETNTYDYLSPVIAGISGYTSDELNTLPLENVVDLIHPDDRAEIGHIIAESMSSKADTSYQMDYRFKRKDGQYRWIQDQFTVMRDADGQPLALIGSVSDITERKQAEEALRGEQWRLRSIIEGTHAGTWEWNVQTGETVFNDVWGQITGYTLDELSPISIKTWEALVHPDDLKKSDELLERHFSGELPYHDCECRMKHKDGHWVWVQDRGRIVTSTADGKPLMMFGTHIDVTLRKQAELSLAESEEKYRMVVENAHEAMVILVNGMFKFANSRIEELTSYSREELSSIPFIEFIHPDDRQMVGDRYRQRLKGEAVPNMYTFRLVSKSGDIKWAEVSATPITWEGGPATLNFLHDVTDSKRLEEEQQRVAKLESVGLLAGGIAHDFNNILTSILGNISLASMEAAPGSELKNSLEQAEKASQRAKALTVQLLTFSKGGAPVLKLASLTELLQDTAGFALSGSNVKCNFSIPAGLWHAKIDEGQFSQVVQNLVINAQQAMPAGGSIEISVENLALSKTQSLGRGLPLKEGDYVRIAVTDHGIGIPVDHLEKIFDPFFTTKQKGNGMGLAISFSIARQHGGHISVESELGSGSTFYLYLPASPETVTPKQDKAVASKAVGKARILVMDDEKGVREIAGRMLKHIGYKDIEFAEDGAEAIKLYKASMKAGHPFNVAILDLTIAGGMGGEVAIKKLLKIDPGVKAIVSSGYIDDPVIAKYKDHGFSGVVAKPYTIAELRKAVQDVIGGS